VLRITQARLGLVSLELGILVLSGHAGLGQVVILALVSGTFSAADNPARQAFVAEVVGRDLIRKAVTLNSTAVNVGRVIGPAVAAVLVSTVGLGWCFIGNAASFCFVIASLLLDGRQLLPVPPVPRAAGQLRAGLRYAATVPAIGTFTFEFEVSLPLLACDTFGAPTPPTAGSSARSAPARSSAACTRPVPSGPDCAA
jgi:MFS family permease